MGTLDGRGHRIFELHIHRPEKNGVGLFGYIGAGGEVRRLDLHEAHITGDDLTGGLAGENAGLIEKCSVHGTVTGTIRQAG